MLYTAYSFAVDLHVGGGEPQGLHGGCWQGAPQGLVHGPG